MPNLLSPYSSDFRLKVFKDRVLKDMYDLRGRQRMPENNFVTSSFMSGLLARCQSGVQTKKDEMCWPCGRYGKKELRYYGND